MSTTDMLLHCLTRSEHMDALNDVLIVAHTSRYAEELKHKFARFAQKLAYSVSVNQETVTIEHRAKFIFAPIYRTPKRQFHDIFIDNGVYGIRDEGLKNSDGRTEKACNIRKAYDNNDPASKIKQEYDLDQEALDFHILCYEMEVSDERI